jgi:hypothetical protein
MNSKRLVTRGRRQYIRAIKSGQGDFHLTNRTLATVPVADVVSHMSAKNAKHITNCDMNWS